MRGVLALIVMGVHVCAFAAPGPILLLSQIPVGLFFLLSGIVLTRSWDGRLLPFLAKRAIRLWPVYAITLAAGLLIARQPPVWLEFVWIPWPRYDGATVNGPIWSLIIEAWAAPFMPLIAWSGRGSMLRMLGCVLVTFAAGRVFPPALFGILFILGAALSGVTFRARLLEGPVPLWLGRVSYSLYLSHWLVLKACSQAFGTPGLVLAVPLALLIAEVLCRWVEIPSIALSRRVGRRIAQEERVRETGPSPPNPPAFV
jgi:peptidoglycan/LPS O-acetylase OafA/YrhL